MSDRSWMLNASALRAARKCVALVRSELGVKLLLSEPDFIQMLHEHVEISGSKDLQNAYSNLLSFAGPGSVLRQLKPVVEEVPLAAVSGETFVVEQDSITYAGKDYPRWRDGKQFSGLYRGQPRYE